MKFDFSFVLRYLNGEFPKQSREGSEGERRESANGVLAERTALCCAKGFNFFSFSTSASISAIVSV